MKIANVTIDADKLPKIPEVVQQLIQSLNNDDVDIQKLARQISLDQVITARILRVANSPIFGGQRDIATVNDAVIRLGLNTVRSLVMAAGFVTTLKSPADFDIKNFWRHSFRIATLCKWLAQFSELKDVDREAAFCCGMMNNIGVLVIHIIYPKHASEIETLVSHGGNRLSIEASRLEYTNNDVASLLAEHWHFPTLFQYALFNQANPLGSDGDSVNIYAALIYIAKYLDDSITDECNGDAIAVSMPVEVVNAIGIDCERVIAELEAAKELLHSSHIFID